MIILYMFKLSTFEYLSTCAGMIHAFFIKWKHVPRFIFERSRGSFFGGKTEGDCFITDSREYIKIPGSDSGS